LNKKEERKKKKKEARGRDRSRARGLVRSVAWSDRLLIWFFAVVTTRKAVSNAFYEEKCDFDLIDGGCYTFLGLSN
jgi:hypothetical protein